MQEKNLFEYAVIRVVPRVEREEFINVGVILYCQSQRFLQSKIILNRERLCAFVNVLDCDELEKNLASFEKISAGGKDGGPIGALPLADRFRWLTAPRSTVIQTSPVHLGLCSSPPEELNKLFIQLVE